MWRSFGVGLDSFLPIRRQIHSVIAWAQVSKKEHVFPELLESDISEKMVHGDGPGGAKVNTALNAVRLVHIPTGVTVKCHESRSTAQNRKIARERLITKLDNFINGENSFEALKKKEIKTREAKNKASRAKKREMRLLAKEKFGT